MRSLCGFLPLEEDLLRQPVEGWWVRGQKGFSPLPFMAVLRFVWYRGSASSQTSLYKTVRHFRIVPRRGCSLVNDWLQALPERAVGADREAIRHFCQLLHLVGFGGGAYREGLSPKGEETAMNRPSAHVNCGHAGKAHLYVSEGGHLGVVPGGA